MKKFWKYKNNHSRELEVLKEKKKHFPIYISTEQFPHVVKVIKGGLKDWLSHHRHLKHFKKMKKRSII